MVTWHRDRLSEFAKIVKISIGGLEFSQIGGQENPGVNIFIYSPTIGRGIIYWIFWGGVEFVWKAWIYFEKLTKNLKKGRIFISKWAKSDEFCI